MTERIKKYARGSLGHTDQVGLKLHPDMRKHVEIQAKARYISISEYVRTLVLADMEAKGVFREA